MAAYVESHWFSFQRLAKNRIVPNERHSFLQDLSREELLKGIATPKEYEAIYGHGKPQKGGLYDIQSGLSRTGQTRQRARNRRTAPSANAPLEQSGPMGSATPPSSTHAESERQPNAGGVPVPRNAELSDSIRNYRAIEQQLDRFRRFIAAPLRNPRHRE